ncbi:23S rRNA accumulation protein YceD [Thalassotalea aquiviva]|uniref:23S rRNA accumulation protein YceD n=1 Tax=Thalassotalea aquiviva TaxID=3242415 RepID=UPI00352B7DBC
MQNLKLPVTIDPYKSAQRRLVCDGFFESVGLKRLLDESEKAHEHVNVIMKFEVDEQGLVLITGEASTSVSLICQRCNHSYEQELAVKFAFSPVKNEEDAEHLPSDYDAIELDENGEVNLRDLVEDELILALPLIPKHEPSDCSGDSDSSWGKLPDTLEKPNPFDVLKQLK